MVKRKAEDYPYVDLHWDSSTSEIILTEGSSQSEQTPASAAPTGGERQEGVPECHLEPVRPEVADALGAEDNPFWALLALIGYEVW